MWKNESIALWTMIKVGMERFKRSALQVILPPVVTTFLYLTIFGKVIGNQIGTVDGIAYDLYIAPGLIMMTLINSSFNGTLGTVFFSKFIRNIEELLIAPVSTLTFLLGLTVVGALRGIINGLLVSLVASLFVPIHFDHIGIALLTAVLTSMLFSQLGFTNAIFAKKWDDISIATTFIITPITYLGGVFFSIKNLPQVWQNVALWNPILYIINAFRYGFIGLTDVTISTALVYIFGFVFVAGGINYYLLKRGIGVRT